MTELTQKDIEAWIRVMATFRPMPTQISKKSSAFGVKNDVDVFFKLYRGVPQVNVWYGQKWYPFNAAPVQSKEEAQGLISMNLKYPELYNSVEHILQANKIIEDLWK